MKTRKSFGAFTNLTCGPFTGLTHEAGHLLDLMFVSGQGDHDLKVRDWFSSLSQSQSNH